MRAIETAAALFGPGGAVVLDIASPLTGMESLALATPTPPLYSFEELNLDEVGWTAHRGAEIAREAGFDAEARATLTAPIWRGVVDVAGELDAAVIVIGSGRAILGGDLAHKIAKRAGRLVLISPPARDGTLTLPSLEIHARPAILTAGEHVALRAP